MQRVLRLTFAVAVLILVGVGSAVGIAYWVAARRFVAGDAHALDRIVRAPVSEPLVLGNVSLWDWTRRCGSTWPVRRGQRRSPCGHSLADLVLLDGDSLADIEAVSRVELVMKEGRIVYGSEPSPKPPE